MRTSKPISTIAYQDEAFLISRLQELKKAKKVEYWMMIPHKGEGDDLKDHIHLYIQPATLIQTEDLREYLQQFDPENPEKPLGCISFRNSKPVDWICYVLHDKYYLEAHCPNEPEKKYTYLPEEIVNSDPDEFNRLFHDAKYRELEPLTAIKVAISKSVDWSDLVASGAVPVGMIRQYKEMYFAIFESMNRNDMKARREEAKTEGDLLLEQFEKIDLQERSPYLKGE